MREHLDAESARRLDEEVRELMRRYGVSALYLADAEAKGGLRFWSLGDGHIRVLKLAQQPQLQAAIQERVAQAA